MVLRCPFFTNSTFIFINHFSTDSYLQSKNESKLCKNKFVENNDYIKVGKIDFIENSKLVLVAIIFISWFLFTVVGYLLKLTNQRKDVNLTILKWVPLGFSASILISITIGISINKLHPENFCLMNSQDGICSSVETNCFRKANPSESLFTSDFGFGKLLAISSTNKRYSGKGYKIFEKHKQLPVYLYLTKNFQELPAALQQQTILIIMFNNIILENSEFNLIILLLKMANK